MNKNTLNYVVDLLMLLSFLVTSITGAIIFFFLPSGIKQGRFQEFMGIEKQVFSFFHDWAGLLLILLVILHFLLHWECFTIMTKNLWQKNKSNN
jgi:hypothetical protein